MATEGTLSCSEQSAISSALYNIWYHTGSYGQKLLTSCPTHKQEDQNLSALCDCSFDILAANPVTEG